MAETPHMQTQVTARDDDKLYFSETAVFEPTRTGPGGLIDIIVVPYQ